MRVAVVGAGIIGCSIAWELATRGVSVDLFDMRAPGDGATQASAGMLAPFIEGHSPLLRDLGARALNEYDAFVARLQEDAHLPIEYRRNGSLQVALSDREAEDLGAYAASYAREALQFELLDARAVRALEPSLTERVTAGLLVPSHGYVKVRDMSRALHAGLEARGVDMTMGVPVDRIAAGSRSATVSVGGRLLEYDHVVLATGCWSGSLVVDGAPPLTMVRPVKGQILSVRLRDAGPQRVIWAPRGYLVPWSDGSVLFGATVEEVGFDERPTVDGVRGLIEAMRELFPSWGDAELGAVRVGLRPATPDGCPIIGPLSSGGVVVLATGHYRTGIVLAPLTALLVADLLVDGVRRPELALALPSRFGL